MLVLWSYRHLSSFLRCVKEESVEVNHLLYLFRKNKPRLSCSRPDQLETSLSDHLDKRAT